MLGKLCTGRLDKFIHQNVAQQIADNALVVSVQVETLCFSNVFLIPCDRRYIFSKTWRPFASSTGNQHEISLLAARYATPSGSDCGGRSPSSSRFGRRSPVPRQRVLRSQRPAPGQVRDAAQRAGRGASRCRGGRCVRLLATGLLRRSNRVCPRRLAGPAATQAGAKTAAQIDRRSPRDTGGGGTRGWHDAECGGTRLALGRSLCNRSAPAHHCSTLGTVLAATGKKTALTVAPVDTLDVTRYATQYELLRSQFTSAASGGTDAARAVTQPRGAGLALLLREGLPAWMRAVRQVLNAAVALPPSNDVPPVAPGASDNTVSSASVLPLAQRRDVTTLLASLVLSTRRWVASAPRQEYRPCR